MLVIIIFRFYGLLRGLGSNGTENRVKESRRRSDDHVPGVHRLAQSSDIG